MINRNIYILLAITFGLLVFCQNARSETVENKLEALMLTHQGKVIYLDFWASWCVPCRKSFPWLNEMEEKYSSQGFMVISVNLDNEKSFAEKFLQEVPAKFTIIYDPKSSLVKPFAIKGMPSSFLFDRQGNKISSHVGFNQQKQKQFELEITNALKQVR
ncbi:TlpA family protein disulfide reductase [Colwellia sp. D2M02]|nr:TlpA disulfide reductase family protein [Colwellia sp. D2M02]MBU2891731.1 TlpA family protein disulfide reductase [Colwellia sp. D2M02]